ncbi:hypothetical protein Ddye_012226 [Dipteronia dyeriana]|uniref:Uncharacterized protein n=1 Tax=Dipteronia dyeriana TaxID=168575 RepID=A0AAD9X425_9ROSI|nr:hypothetical protein Ddye_012226 [Dipteronia dyeriana]
MIVLRMRIRENKMLETRNETPSNWMEWEKKYYANNGYNEDVCEALRLLSIYDDRCLCFGSKCTILT